MSERQSLAETWNIQCPACGAVLLKVEAGALACQSCGQTYLHSDGVIYLADLKQTPDLGGFVENYKRIRAAQGYVGHKSAFYCQLPDYPKNGAEAGIWHIRQRSFARLMQHVGRVYAPDAKIVDLGSGNGWLSHQLAKRGYRPCGVDINDDPDDGLRAVRHYPLAWLAILSSFDRLPFPDGAVDVAVYNGSFHYSENQAKTLQEAMRILRPGGQIIIMDSPIYSDPSSGQKMLAERARYHQDRFDYTPEIEVSGFLTWQGVRGLAAQHGLALSILRPWYGLKWFLRPLKHRLRGVRQPANFSLLVLTKPLP